MRILWATLCETCPVDHVCSIRGLNQNGEEILRGRAGVCSFLNAAKVFENFSNNSAIVEVRYFFSHRWLVNLDGTSKVFANRYAFLGSFGRLMKAISSYTCSKNLPSINNVIKNELRCYVEKSEKRCYIETLIIKEMA